MKRFNFDEEDDNEEDHPEKFFGPDFFSMAQFPLENNGTLECVVKICEKSFFWKFYNLETKLKKIKQAYNFLRDLQNEEEEKGE